MPSGKPSFTVRELAEKTSTSREHIQRLVNNGQIPSYTVGRARRIPSEAVDALMGIKAAKDELDAYIQELVDAAPKLTALQLNRLTSIIGPAKSSARRGGAE